MIAMHCKYKGHQNNLCPHTEWYLHFSTMSPPPALGVFNISQDSIHKHLLKSHAWIDIQDMDIHMEIGWKLVPASASFVQLLSDIIEDEIAYHLTLPWHHVSSHVAWYRSLVSDPGPTQWSPWLQSLSLKLIFCSTTKTKLECQMHFIIRFLIS